MASRAELIEAVRQLQSAPGFRLYVLTLQGHRDHTVKTLLTADPAQVERLRGEAAAYDKLLSDILNNLDRPTS